MLAATAARCAAAPAPAASPLPRMASLFDQMEAEMDALTRTFFGDAFAPFFGAPRRAAPLWRRADPLLGAAWPPVGMAPGARADVARVAADVTEDEGGFTITADVPGMTKDDVKVALEDGVLSIAGERKSEASGEAEGGRARWVERSRGSFRRAFALPEGVDAEGIAAAIRDGVLTVRVPRAQVPPKPPVKEIPVE